MNRTTAIVLTIVTSLLCGLPGLGVICFGIIGGIGTQMPNFQGNASPANLVLGVGIFLCIGSLLILIPILVGFFSFKLSKASETAQANPNTLIPPAS